MVYTVIFEQSKAIANSKTRVKQSDSEREKKKRSDTSLHHITIIFILEFTSISEAVCKRLVVRMRGWAHEDVREVLLLHHGTPCTTSVRPRKVVDIGR